MADDDTLQLTVATTTQLSGSIEVVFLELQGLSIAVSNGWLTRQGVSLEALVPGTRVIVKGKEGNRLADLWGVNKLASLALMS